MALIRLFFLLHESLIGRPLYYRDSVRIVNKACIHYVKRRACTEDETIRVCSRPTHPSRNSRWDKRVKTKMRKLSCHLRLSVACLITRPVDIYIYVFSIYFSLILYSFVQGMLPLDCLISCGSLHTPVQSCHC